ncbi:recombinase family protein [Actinoplanes sp. Pm04-4]|uniref:Recombinase family protein n=1 Tax=Paractinoplanes pyxinae TaxID=2997416 RepID=A0ABT4BHF3_9ACTN|nr:recombinase family protein [Actinoplanes pyxinae]MCY1145255.1 recombinase family protein [Actinoplanes pyxinae]
MARVLGVLRLSRDKDESTSIVRQREAIERWTEYEGHTIIGWAEDLDVSGGVSPFDRPSLGPWLTSAKAGEYDVIAAWKLDRLSRRLFHTFDLLKWAESHSKSVVPVEDKQFDLSTPIGRALMAILAAIAEGELEAIQQRQRGTFAKLMKVGRWRGGFVPYGYVSAKAEKGEGWRLEIDPEAAGYVKEIVRRIVVEKQSTNSVVRWLNDSKVPTSIDIQAVRAGREPRGTRWRPGNLLRMLRSHTLLGYAEITEKRKLPDGREEEVTRLVRDDEGMPLERADALLTRGEWQELQDTLDANSNKRAGNRSGGSPLLRVAYCECGRPLYRNQGRNHFYYRCSSRSDGSVPCPRGNTKSIRADELESAVEEFFLGWVGDLELTRREFVPGNNNASRLADIERALRELREDRAAGLYSGDRGSEEFRQMYRDLEAKRAKLEAEPSKPDEWVEVPTGETYRDRWNSLETAAQRAADLRAAGVKVIVFAEPPKQPNIWEAMGRPAPVDLAAPSETASRITVQLSPDMQRRALEHAAKTAASPTN